MSTETDKIYARQPGRGRLADTPTQIPPPGWKDILWRLYRSIGNDHILLTAAGVTFYLLLALVPTLTAFVSIYGLFNDRSSVLDQVELLSGLVPPGALEILRDQLNRLVTKSADTLGLTLIISLSIALWSASAGVKAMFEAMNVAYHEQERRSFFVFNGLALLFTLGVAIASVMVLGVVVVLPAFLALMPGGAELEWTVRILSYVAMLAVLSFGIAALYRWGASREKAKWRWITPGAIFAVLALGISSVTFSWYVTNFTDDTAAYGSLGAMIGLMIWLWISSTLVIIGAELNSEMEHQTARDTTTGSELPLGQRGAYVADTVGRVWPMAREKVEQPATIERESKRERKPFSLKALVLGVPTALAIHWSNRQKS